MLYTLCIYGFLCKEWGYQSTWSQTTTICVGKMHQWLHKTKEYHLEECGHLLKHGRCFGYATLPYLPVNHGDKYTPIQPTCKGDDIRNPKLATRDHHSHVRRRLY